MFRLKPKEDPFFEIFVEMTRIGHEAGQKLPDIVELGYRDAWIVPDKIVQRKVRAIAPAATPR